MEHLLDLADNEKLKGSDARDLTRYTRLLNELWKYEERIREEVERELNKLTPEQLEAMAAELYEKEKLKKKTKERS